MLLCLNFGVFVFVRFGVVCVWVALLFGWFYCVVGLVVVFVGLFGELWF